MEIENDWAGHLMAIEIMCSQLEGYSRCSGFANAGVCFGCQYCYRGVVYDGFSYVLGDGKVRTAIDSETRQMFDAVLSTAQSNEPENTELRNEWIYAKGEV